MYANIGQILCNLLNGAHFYVFIEMFDVKAFYEYSVCVWNYMRILIESNVLASVYWK